MKNENKKLKSKNYGLLKINKLVGYIFFLLLIIPSFKIISYYNWIVGFLSILWILTALLTDGKFFLFSNKIIVVEYIFWIYIFAFIVITLNLTLFGRMFGLFLLLLIQVMYLFYKKNNERFIYSTSKLLLFIIPIICFVSTYFSLKIPYLIRAIDKDNYLGVYNNFKILGVGGYSLVYTSVLLIPICLYALLYDKRKTKFTAFLYFINIVVGSFFVLTAGFSIATFTLITSVIILLIIKRVNIKSIGFLFSILLISYFSFDFLMEKIFPVFLLLFSKMPYYKMKLIEISEILMYHQIQSASVTKRLYNYGTSIDSIKKYPFFGSIVSDSLIFGNHSTILDVTSIFGIFTGLLLIYLLFSTIISFFKKYNIVRSNSIILLSMISLFIILFFNNDIPTLGLPLFFLLPTILEKVNNEKIDRQTIKNTDIGA